MADVSKAVLITGCSTGIGRATAELLAEKGYNVYATARRQESIEDLVEKGCKVMPLDVTDETSMQTGVRAVVDAEGAVGALVNNAGYSQSGAVEDVPLNDVRRQFETNVFGLIRMCQLVLPGMRAQGYGRIVNLSSVGGKVWFPGGGIYHGTKHAVEGISDALRWEVREFGVQVVIIEPGLIKTKFADAAVGSIDEATPKDGTYAEFNKQVAETTAGAYEGPMSRLAAEPEAVARKIEKAIRKRRPKPRYMVTGGARVLVAQRRMLPDRGWDAIMSTQFKRPTRG